MDRRLRLRRGDQGLWPPSAIGAHEELRLHVDVETGMLRRTPLKRRKRISPKRATPRRSSRVRDAAYMAFIRALPCCARIFGDCRGSVTAHHAGERGLGMKCSDRETIPLCVAHHTAWHDATEPFSWWGKEMRQIWARVEIARAQAAYERMAA